MPPVSEAGRYKKQVVEVGSSTPTTNRSRRTVNLACSTDKLFLLTAQRRSRNAQRQTLCIYVIQKSNFLRE